MRPGHAVNGATFFDDFIGRSISGTVDITDWVVIIDSGATVVLAEDEPHGVLTLTPSGGSAQEDAGVELNGKPFQFNREVDMFFEIRLKVSAIATTTSDILVGLCEATPDLDSGSLSAIDQDLMGFFLEAANINAITGDGTNETREDTNTDLVADTYVVLSWKWHAQSQTVRYYVDGVRKVTQSVADGDYIPTDGVNLTMVIMNELHAGGAAVALDVDYVLFTTGRA
jgi:hypothetical protein